MASFSLAMQKPRCTTFACLSLFALRPIPYAMGESKRRKRLLEAAPCLCGSERRAVDCCLVDGKYFRAPSKIDLWASAKADAMARCYLRDTDRCVGPMSREHLISAAVLRAVYVDQLVVSGFPWLPNGQTRSIGFKELTNKCLCSAHNNALSPLDLAAGRFFTALRVADLNRSGPAFSQIVSGHDIERWMLKTLFAFAHSKSLASNGSPINPVFHPKIDPVTMLADPAAWVIGSGLSFRQPPGSLLLRSDGFGLAPFTLPGSNEIVGMTTSIQGFAFDLRAVPFDTTSPGHFRPSSIRFRHPNVVNEVTLCWSDGREHEAIDLDFAMTNAEATARGIKIGVTP